MADQDAPNQPRQPRDMEGLLKFCMHATQSEDAPNSNEQSEPIDPERLRWLQDAMRGMTVDVVQQLAEGRILILSKNTKFCNKCFNPWVRYLN